MSEPGRHPASDERGKGGFWTSLPGILTGLAALLTAVMGLMSLLPESEEGSSTPEVATAPAVSQVTASRSVDPAPTATTAGVFVEGQLKMRTPDSVDLEKGMVGQSPPGYDLYLHCSAVATCILNSMGSLLTTAGDANGKDSCVDALKKRQDIALETAYLQEGQALCIQTKDGHVGRLQILGLPGPGSIDFEFSYTLWN